MSSEARAGRTIATITGLRRDLAGLLNVAAYGGERIVISRHGKPIAALVPIADWEELEELDRFGNEHDRAAIAASRGEPTVPLDELIRGYGIDPDLIARAAEALNDLDQALKPGKSASATRQTA